jgi:putative copper resistance protein D
VDVVLIGVRALHFAATVTVAGLLSFGCLIAGPAGARSLADGGRFRRQLSALLWASLGLALISGVAWLLVLSAGLVKETTIEALSEGVPWTVLAETRFGHAWSARFAMAGLIAAAALRFDIVAAPSSWRRRAGALLLGAGFVGLLASSGHAGATGGVLGAVHWTADALHLIAAAAWLGGLVPLVLLLAAASRAGNETAAQIADRATRRFSVLGIVAVATIVATGGVNAVVLVGGLPALVASDYGRVLLIKIAVFAIMLALAADNRLGLSPRIREVPFMRRLALNALAEVWLGLVVIVIVSVLGTLVPGTHLHHVH